jgi:hypothetical protein
MSSSMEATLGSSGGAVLGALFRPWLPSSSAWRFMPPESIAGAGEPADRGASWRIASSRRGERGCFRGGLQQRLGAAEIDDEARRGRRAISAGGERARSGARGPDEAAGPPPQLQRQLHASRSAQTIEMASFEPFLQSCMEAPNQRDTVPEPPRSDQADRQLPITSNPQAAFRIPQPAARSPQPAARSSQPAVH